jgi:hypothetical protein
LDHERRLQGLQQVQETNAARAELIELNVVMVDKAIQVGLHLCLRLRLCLCLRLRLVMADNSFR